MGLFSKKSGAQAQRVASHAPTSRAPVGPTENAFIPDGGGNIDYGAAMANRVAAESRQQIEQKHQQDYMAKQQSSAKMHEAMNPQHALSQPGGSSNLATINVQTLVAVTDLHEPAWAHHFVPYGIDSKIMGVMQEVFAITFEQANAKIAKNNIKGKAVVPVVQEYGDKAAQASNNVLGKLGITVSVKFYRDQAQRKSFVVFKVPGSIEERDAWKQDLITKYNLKS